MKTIVYDKAIWHIDAGEIKEKVIEHFSFIMSWSSSNSLLTDEGKEILELGVDASISLHSRLFNDRGNKFMTKYYDMFIMSKSDEHGNMKNLLKSL